MRVGAQQQLTVAHGGTGVEDARIAGNHVVGQQFVLGLRRQHIDAFIARNIINLAVGRDWRSVNAVGSRLDSLFVDRFSGFGVDAIRHALALADPKQISVVVNGRRDVRTLGRLPQDLVAHVPLAAGWHGDARFSAAADGIHDAVVGDDARANVVFDARAVPAFLTGGR